MCTPWIESSYNVLILNTNFKNKGYVAGHFTETYIFAKMLQVLERDLAVFGFFIALGRSTQSFLYASGFEVVDEPLEGFIRYSLQFTIFFNTRNSVFLCLITFIILIFYCYVSFLNQTPYRRQCVILSPALINQFLSTIRGGQHIQILI